MAVQLFGFEIKRKSDEADDKRIRSFVEPNEGDGSINVTATVPGAGAAMSSVVDMEGYAKSEAELVQKYRDMLQQPEVQQAVDDVVNEAVIVSYDSAPISCVTDDVKLSDGIRKKIRATKCYA